MRFWIICLSSVLTCLSTVSVPGAGVSSELHPPITDVSGKADDGTSTTGPLPDYRHVVFLNFDGETLLVGQNDSKSNTTSLISVPKLDFPAMRWDAFGGIDRREKVMVELKILFMPYAVEFVTQRPTSGDYTMAMIGGTGEGCKAEDFAVGIAPLDCKNQMKNDVALIYGEKLSSVKNLAFVIAHELAHTFGLEHVVDPKGIMHPKLSEQTEGWVTADLAEPPGVCNRENQDEHKILLENLGAGEGDTILPRIWFVHPGNGAILPSNFSLEAIAADDLRIHHVTIFVDGERRLELSKPPFALPLNDMSDGPHTILAEVYDFKPNKGTAEISITVDSNCINSRTCNTGLRGPESVCTIGADCDSQICATRGPEGRCVAICGPDSQVCPLDTTCQQNGETWACLPDKEWQIDMVKKVEPPPEEGGCHYAPLHYTRGNAALLIMLIFFSIAVAGRRRK